MDTLITIFLSPETDSASILLPFDGWVATVNKVTAAIAGILALASSLGSLSERSPAKISKDNELVKILPPSSHSRRKLEESIQIRVAEGVLLKTLAPPWLLFVAGALPTLFGGYMFYLIDSIDSGISLISWWSLLPVVYTGVGLYYFILGLVRFKAKKEIAKLSNAGLIEIP